MSDTLNVWHDSQLVGKLFRNALDQIGFQYDKKWVHDGFPVSQQLPLATVEYTPQEGIAHRFFANLLPEANARRHLIRDLKISNSDFELLKTLGGECAGALSILPEDHTIIVKTHYKKLTDEDLYKIILRKGSTVGFTTEKNRPRLSLAGAQDKCAVYFDGKHYFLPTDVAPSTHILKFEVTGYRHIPAYEYFLTQLAKAIDLPVVNCELKKIGVHYFLFIERYDRIIQHDKKIHRLHQEDFCQALGVSYSQKYQQEGGPSFQDCFQFIRKVSAKPLIDTENLLKWQIFNVLSGNSDGHAKNLSIIYEQQKYVHLAPFYDLVCTRAIERIDSRLAFSVGGEFNPDRIGMTHWENLASACQIGKPYLKKLLKQIASTLINNIEVVKTNFENEHGTYAALQRVEMVVTKRCKKELR
jgi:serine/threonine-protein kinase HipA